MIPKTIHYCWFSGDEKPDLVKRCIESWHKYLPDYNIKCWDGNSFDFNSVEYVREAMEIKAYAHASDYVRLYALYTEGGIYLDSDVEVFRSFDELLYNQFFSGVEQFPIYYSRNKISRMCNHIQAAIMGSEKSHPYLKDCLDKYHTLHFKIAEGQYDYSEIPERITEIMESYGFKRENVFQKLKNGITIYPNTLIANNVDKIVPNGCYAFHWGVKSWGNDKRGKLYNFCWNHDLMSFYHWLESLRKK